jgi:RecA/RadA recombinase
MDFLKDVVKEIGNEYTQLASEIEENEKFADTGSYILNALISGSIFGGVSANKITAIAGESSTGKTFFSLAVVKNYLNNNPDGYCLYFDTESAINRSLLESRGIDTKRFVVVNVVTVEEFRSKALKAVDIIQKTKKSERKPCLIVLDSLGMLSTNKEISDALDSKDTRDMTKAALIKGAFRMLTLKLGIAEIPMIVTNHTYDSMSMYGGKQMSGGSGLQYASSTIIFLSKSKEKDGTDVVGNLIRAKTQKSRLTKENQEVQVRLFYDERGLDKYYGLVDLAVESGIWTKVSTRIEIDGQKYYEKQIYKNPEKFFTAEVLEKIDVVVKGIFSYGT